MSELFEKVCPVCKATFVTHVANKVYCSQNCKKRASNLRHRGKPIDTPKSWSKNKPKESPKPSSKMTIEEVAIEAMKLDMSYGYYVGKYE